MSEETKLPNGEIEILPEYPFQQLLDAEARVDRLIALSESIATTLKNLSLQASAPVPEAPEAEVQFAGGTPSEILHALLEALKFHGIEKREGRGWQVSVGLQPPRTLKLLRDAIGYRIEWAALVDTAANGTADLTPLARLGQWTLEKIRGHDAGDVDAWAIQDAAKTFGVIAPVPAPKPCGPCCVCEEMDADTCYRDTEETKRARRALAAEGVAGGDHVAEASKMVTDTHRLDALRDRSWMLEPFELTDDAIGWRVTERYMGREEPVEVAVVYDDNPRNAIDAALAAERGRKG